MARTSKKKLAKERSAAARLTGSDGDRPYARLGGTWYVHGGAFLLLVLGTCLLYRGDLGLGFFLLDDPSYVKNNQWIKEVSAENVKHVMSTPFLANYSPVHLLSYMLDDAVAGEDPRAFHWSSNVWGGIVAGWVYLVGVVLLRGCAAGSVRPLSKGATGWWRALQSGRWRVEMFAFLGGLLFVAHPAHVEAVAWISSRKDLVAAAFALPAMLAYFRYRRAAGAEIRRSRSAVGGWYGVSLVLFTFAVGGKLSVVVLPGILFLFDVFEERRRGWGMYADKLPFAVAGMLVMAPTFAVQVSKGYSFDLYVVGHSIMHSLWLLSGFGQYVLARVRPDADVTVLFKAIWVLLPMIVAALPLVFFRRIPGLPVSLIYWVLLSLVPSQVLGFVQPVADRYLFFPSVAVVLPLAWLGLHGSLKVRRGAFLSATVLMAGLALFWATRTISYLSEWQDPRSVWHAARQKTDSFKVHQYLGTHYQNEADRLASRLSSDGSEREQAVALARVFWKDDSRLAALLEEWEKPTGRLGRQSVIYREELRRVARECLERALQGRGPVLVPNVYFRLGSLALGAKQLDRARTMYQQAYEQAQEQRYSRIREELTVRSHHALGAVEWTAGNYEAALDYLRLAEGEQRRFGRNYIPELRSQRETLERLMRGRRGSVK